MGNTAVMRLPVQHANTDPMVHLIVCPSPDGIGSVQVSPGSTGPSMRACAKYTGRLPTAPLGSKGSQLRSGWPTMTIRASARCDPPPERHRQIKAIEKSPVANYLLREW